MPSSFVSRYDNSLGSHIHRTEYFKENLKKLHPNLILIGSYVNFTTKIKVQNKYGICYCLPSRLMNGAVPCIRTAINKTEYFINQAKEIHGDKYDYFLTEYNNSKFIDIICKEHGVFKQRRSHHLKGQGCKKCSSKNLGGWYEKQENFDKITNLYILEFVGNNEKFLKFGVAININKRINRIKNNTNNIYSINILKVKTGKVKKLYNLEQRFKRYIKYKKIQYIPQIHFDGKFECFRKK